MPRVIDKEAALKLVSDPHNQYHRIVKEFLLTAPTIDAEPVRHGRWIILEPYGAHHTQRRKCSECGEIKAQELTNFCPNCGAKMQTKPPEEVQE